MKSVTSLLYAWVVLTSSSLVADDSVTLNELKKAASWQVPSSQESIDQVNRWLSETGATNIDLDSQQSLQASLETASTRLDAVVKVIAFVRPDVKQLVTQLETTSQSLSAGAPKIEFDIQSTQNDDFVDPHVRLYLGRWLAQNRFHDEALEHLQSIDEQSVLTPAVALFYRGLMQHQLLKKEACIATIEKLLENEDQIPRRFAVLGKLMLADIGSLKQDSLDEISRMMNDVTRRTDLNRTGKRVRDQEQQVIKKLDKLIDKLEQQQQQQQAQSASGSGQAPQGPINAAQVAGGGATGEADRKRQDDGGDWGNLPPAKRAAALAEMSKNMPPHYRSVIEAYFRRLADQQENDR